MTDTRLDSLAQEGVAVWLDDISRQALESGHRDGGPAQRQVLG